MAAPTVAADDAQVFAAGTTHVFDLTAGLGTISAGDLLLMFAGAADGVTFTPPANWTELAEYHGASSAEAAVFYLVAAGGETSASFDISASETAAAIVWRITGHDSGTPPVAIGDDDAGTVNPLSPALTPGTTEDFLYISTFFTRGNNTVSVYPYVDGNIVTSGGSLATAAGSWVQTTGSSSETPGAYTKSGSQSWQAVTIAVYPAAAGSTYTLTAEQGSYALSGSTALIDLSMVALQGSYTLTGQATSLIWSGAGSSNDISDLMRQRRRRHKHAHHLN